MASPVSPTGGPNRAPSAEVLGLVAGLRRVWRLRLPVRDLPTWRASAARRGWAFAVADAAVDTSPGGHGLRDVAAGDGPGQKGKTRLVLIGVAEADVGLALALETEALAVPSTPDGDRKDHDGRLSAHALGRTVERHLALGQLYGYPSCCVHAFLDAHLEVLLRTAPRIGDNLAAIVRAAGRSERFDPRLDTLDGGAFASQRSPLRHLPCRFDCSSSIALATRLLDMAASLDAAGSDPRPAADDVVLLGDGSMVRLRPAVDDPATPDRWTGARLAGVDSHDGDLAARLAPCRGATHAALGPPSDWQLEPGVGLRWTSAGASGRIDRPGLGPWRARLPLSLPFASGALRALQRPATNVQPGGRDSTAALA